jgi:5-oxoprolinase (ATP-hydrolysing)
MTNTAIGDVELTERVYPVIIRRFARRHGSGGRGEHVGGDGVIRDIEFTEQLDVAILSQRRVVPPYGMAGGEPGSVGLNHWYRKAKDGKYTVINLGGSNQCVMAAGDHIVIHTPGGGGYGAGERVKGAPVAATPQPHQPRAAGSVANFKSAQYSS